MSSWVWIATVLALVCAPVVPARAYEVQSGFSEGCHEKMTVLAFLAALEEPIWSEVPVPEGDTWRKLAQSLNEWALDEELVGEDLSDPQLFALFSLVLGVRQADTEGRSISDLASQRWIHADPRPEAQYRHALRGPHDDEPDGSRNATRGIREAVRRPLSDAAAVLLGPLDEQLSTAPFTLDFYNLFYVDVWQPGFLLGQAAQSLQDSFSHTIRCDDCQTERSLQRIVYVLNYIDAIYGGFDETRDGMAHSEYLDRCGGPPGSELDELYVAANDAMTDLFEAFLQTTEGNENAVDDLLDAWVTFQDGCTFDNELCGNARWIEAARKDPTGPYLPSWMSCSAGARTVATGFTWLLMPWVLLFVRARMLRRQ